MTVQKRAAPKAEPEEIQELPEVDPNGQLASDVDALLEEIDDVLEENAEAFVAGYIQSGGE